MLTAVLLEVSKMVECSSRSDCSEIKGLEHRLFKLAQMQDESKRLAAEQLNLYEVSIFDSKSIIYINNCTMYNTYMMLEMFCYVVYLFSDYKNESFKSC